MTCEYNFTVEYYHTLSRACYDCPLNVTDCARPHCVAADGTKRGIMTVNRMVPGPGIHVSNWIIRGIHIFVNVVSYIIIFFNFLVDMRGRHSSGECVQQTGKF